MRKAAATDFNVEVEGLGSFRFGRRTMRDEVAIQAEYARLSEGAPLTPWLFRLCTWLATIRVLMVGGPEEFDPMALDPLDEDTYATLEAVHDALREQEARFRGKSRKGREEVGEAAGEDGGVLVSEEIQPSAD